MHGAVGGEPQMGEAQVDGLAHKGFHWGMAIAKLCVSVKIILR